MKYYARIFVCFAFVLIESPDKSHCQTTAFDSFAQVTVADNVPVFDQDAKKTYTTTVTLQLNPGVTFRTNSFIDAAKGFYNSAFIRGFFDVNNVRNTALSNRQMQVTYDAVYVYPLLLDAVSGSDATIVSTIGTFAAVRNGLNAQSDIFGFFPVTSDSSSFSFGGSQMCPQAGCNGTYVSCVETTAGVTATCVSQCKDGYCYNGGLCLHENRNVVPQCRCPTYPDLWVLGSRCETKFALWLAVLLAVIGFLILAVIIFIIIVCVRRKRRKLKKKEELLNSVPKSHINPGFQGDTGGTRLSGTSYQGNNAVAREDSFETVTSSGRPTSNYTSRNSTSRRANENASTLSHNTDRRHNRHDRGRRRRSNSDTSRSTSHKSDSSNKRPAITSASSNNENSSDTDDPSNISFYEVDVNESDLHSEAASSVAVDTSAAKPSPIRWLPPKSNEPRPGWVPSLGPLMYDLPTENNTNNAAHNEIERRHTRGTDV